MKTALLIILAILSYLTLASATPNLSTTTAVIPYPELKALLEAQAATTPPPKPPVPWAISQISVRPAAANGHTSLEIIAKGFTLAPGYHFIPIVHGNVSLESAKSENCQLIHQPNGFNLLTEKTGTFTATILLRAPDITPPGSNFTIENPNAFPLHTSLPDQPPFPISVIAPKPGTLTFRHSTSRENTATEDHAPTSWSATTHVAITPIEDTLACTARIHITGDKGNASSTILTLPPKSRSPQASAQGLASAIPLRTSDGQRTLTLQWEDAHPLDRTITLTYRLPLPSSTTIPWSIEAPSVSPEDSITFSIGTPPALTLITKGATPTSQPLLRTKWFREALGNNTAHVITLPEGNALSAKVTPRWAEHIATQSATIPRATFKTRVIEDGNTLTNATISIIHSAPWTLQLDHLLAPGSSLITCAINSDKASPVRQAETALSLHLPTPKDTDTPVTTVNLTFSNSTTPLDLVSGRLDLALPSIPNLIETTHWEITLPPAYEPTAVQGNLTFSTNHTNTSNKNILHLQKNLTQNQRPATEIYYQRQDLNN